MKLHEDRFLFEMILKDTEKMSGIRADILEKDYYVTLFLEELSKFQDNGLKAYFKGGTALYKALKATNRFSEDIDLSVDTRNATNSQNKAMLERATKKYTGLPRDKEKGESFRSSITSFYTYRPVINVVEEDEMERFGNLMIEATSFTISEPTEKLEITPLVFDFANAKERYELAEKYDVKPFKVGTITLERIFVDKLFAAEAYLRRPNQEVDAAKHIYDLAVLSKNERIKKLLKRTDLLESLLKIRMEEELGRRDGIPNVSPSDFIFFENRNTNVENGFRRMQNLYVFDPKYRMKFKDAMDCMKGLQSELTRNTAWMGCKPINFPTNEAETGKRIEEKQKEKNYLGR